MLYHFEWLGCPDFFVVKKACLQRMKLLLYIAEEERSFKMQAVLHNNAKLQYTIKTLSFGELWVNNFEKRFIKL